MAINKKLIHFKTKAAFEAQLNNILDTSIVFIQDANLIWTHGTYYCLPSDEVVISNGIEPDKDQDLWIDTSDNTTATFIEEAPIDGKKYVRKNGTWVAILNEVYVGETEPTNGEVVWINPDTDVMKYWNGLEWATISGKLAPETLIINLASNQTNPDNNLNGVIVNVRYADTDHRQAWRGEALSFYIPDGTKYTIEYSDITDENGNKIYATPTAETYTAVSNKTRTLSKYYNSEKLTVNVSGVSSGFTVTVNGQNQTATSGTYYIPYGTAYTISASSVKGYNIETSEFSITASQQTRIVTITYTKMPNGVYICDNTGALTTVESWNTANNDSAVGVAVVSDNCSFVIDKERNSTRIWGGEETTISGIPIITDNNIAKIDYAGESNTTEIINQLGSGNAPAADYCRSRSCTVNGTTLYGYLGALGEWWTAYNNKAAVDSALSKIGGAAMVNDWYWSSTQSSSKSAYKLYWPGGSFDVANGFKNGSNKVRAFYPIP